MGSQTSPLARVGQEYSMQRVATTSRPCVCSTAFGVPVVPPLKSSAATSEGSASRRPSGRSGSAASSATAVAPGPRQTTSGMPSDAASPSTSSRVSGAQTTARGAASRKSGSSCGPG